MTHMLAVVAGKFRHPVFFLVPVIADNRLQHSWCLQTTLDSMVLFLVGTCHPPTA